MIDFIWDISQQSQISSAQSAASDAKSSAAQTTERVFRLESDLHRLTLVCQAMWELLRSKHGTTDADLIRQIGEVDLRDGAKDNRMTPKRMNCPHCARVINTANPSCLYCGTQLRKPHVFQ